MADILIRGLKSHIVARLKARARLAGRSLQSEVRLLLEREAAQVSIDEALQRARNIRAGFRGQFDDSSKLIRESRER